MRWLHDRGIVPKHQLSDVVRYPIEGGRILGVSTEVKDYVSERKRYCRSDNLDVVAFESGD
jgi:hypothetical protein